MKKTLSPLIVVLLVAACSTTQSAPSSTPVPPTDSPVPEPTNTSIPPTQIPPIIEVTFDGNGCTVEGPTELPAGEHRINFIQEVGLRGVLYVEYLDDGKTTQDSLDLQIEPGEYFPQPSWAHHYIKTAFEYEEYEGIRVVTSTWNLDKVGTHNILCYVPTPEEKLWFYGPIKVVEALSD